MKRTVRIVSLVLVLAMMLSIGANAATVYDLETKKADYSDCRLVPQVAAGTDAESETANAVTSNGTVTDKDGKKITYMIFKDVGKIQLTYTPGAANEQNIVFMLNKAEGTVPNGTNIVYIDQKATASGQINFTIYPSDLDEGEYGIYVASASKGYKEIGSLKISKSFSVLDFVLGDVKVNGEVDIADVVELLNHLAGNIVTLTDKQKNGADVDGNGAVDIADAVKILNFIAGNIVSF